MHRYPTLHWLCSEDLTKTVQKNQDGARYQGATDGHRSDACAAGMVNACSGPKEGLAMNNGAQLTTSIAALSCWDAQQLILLRGSRHGELGSDSWCDLRDTPRSTRCVPTRSHSDGRQSTHTSRRFRNCIPRTRVNPATCLFHTMYATGARRGADAVRYASEQVTVELNAATDNPLILMDAAGPNKAYSAGLFHGEPVGMVGDHPACPAGCIVGAKNFQINHEIVVSTPLLADESPLGMMAPQTTVRHW